MKGDYSGQHNVAVLVDRRYADSFFDKLKDAAQQKPYAEQIARLRVRGASPEMIRFEDTNTLANALVNNPDNVNLVLIARGQHRGCTAEALDYCKMAGTPVYVFEPTGRAQNKGKGVFTDPGELMVSMHNQLLASRARELEPQC